MSDDVRGRVLIINIRKFYKNGQVQVDKERHGSEVDHDRLNKLFVKMGFEIAETEQSDNITAVKMCSRIKLETQRAEHHRHGMFVFVLMTHGASENTVYDSQCQMMYLEDIKKLLAPVNFPAMKGKPKMVIVQACSGGDLDYVTGAQSTRPHSQPTAASRGPPGRPILNVDDFIIMRAAGESYQSARSTTNGSFFISALVEAFYCYANYQDMETLFKVVQHRVREKSIAYTKEGTSDLGGQVPVAQCTFTNFRKLYLFPGYRTRPLN